MRWKAVSRYEGYYEINEAGQVRRVAKARGAKVGRVLRVRYCGQKKNRAYVMLSVGCEIQRVSVSRSVLMAFVREPRPGEEANHKDGDSFNNHIGNLGWVSSSENKKHATRMGAYYRLFSKRQVQQIRAWYASGKYSQQAIAEYMNVSQPVISGIVRGVYYADDTFSEERLP